MSNRLISMSVAALMFAGTNVALAAGDNVSLTESQKQQIARDIGSQAGENAPSGFHAAVGTKVPNSLTLHPLPSNVSSSVSSVKNYEYVKLQDTNEILLVNPSDRMIVAVIHATGTTTGSGGKKSK